MIENKAKQVKVEIVMDMEYTEEFDTKRDYNIELQGIKEELQSISNELVQQIYSVKLKNQKTKISFL